MTMLSLSLKVCNPALSPGEDINLIIPTCLSPEDLSTSLAQQILPVLLQANDVDHVTDLVQHIFNRSPTSSSPSITINSVKNIFCLYDEVKEEIDQDLDDWETSSVTKKELPRLDEAGETEPTDTRAVNQKPIAPTRTVNRTKPRVKKKVVGSPMRHNGNKPKEWRRCFWCEVDQCGERFGRLKELREHHRSHHIDLYCNKCSTAFKSLREYSGHFCSRRHKCETCPRDFNTKFELRNHRLIHQDAKLNVCDLCGKRFRQEMTLTRHRLTHESTGQFTCRICSKSFKFKHYLAQHEMVHTGAKPHSCNFCLKTFTQRSNMLKHIKQTHTQVKEHICPICSKGFVQPYYLKRHLHTHKPLVDQFFPSLLEKVSSAEQCVGIRVISCTLCPATMKDEDSLRSHIERLHPDTILSLEDAILPHTVSRTVLGLAAPDTLLQHHNLTRTVLGEDGGVGVGNVEEEDGQRVHLFNLGDPSVKLMFS